MKITGLPDVRMNGFSLSRAIKFATDMHYDRYNHINGEPGILHPMRVMLSFKNVELQIVAILHDVVEDCGVTERTLRYSLGLDVDIVAAVMAISRRQGEDYMEYIKRLSVNMLARKVKLADLTDNLRRDRITNPTDKDLRRWEKYEKAKKYLESVEEASA